MKGSVFTIFQEMVEETFGFECWESLLSQCDLPSGGIYTAAATYADEEILALVGALSEYSDVAVPDLVEAFGKYLFPRLAHTLPAKMMEYDGLWSFLEAVNSVIHVEVQKLHAGAFTPEVVVLDKTEDKLILKYKSPRKLCFLALGLVHQAAEHFDSVVDITHELCMHDGSDHCRLLVTKH